MTLRDTVIDAGGVLIAGGGLAGLFTALMLAPRPVTVLSAAPLGAGASSVWAQGGIAAAFGPDDGPAQHAADTLAAGAGLCDPEIVRLLTEEAPARVEDLARLGVPFDRDAQGRFTLGREAAHRRNRIVRVAGDRAGAAIMAALIAAVARTPSIRVVDGLSAIELGVCQGRAAGLFARDRDGRTVFVAAQSVVLALGGVGALYAVTTNPAQARGQGLGLAARAGARIADPEFVQFHPTAIAVGRDPAPLATEALRGEGAILVDEHGHRFMPSVHPDAELAPRDVVARALHRQLAAGRRTFLDARAAVGARFPTLFPTVYAACRAAGIDPVREAIPVAPAAHYHMGGLAVDAQGRSSIPGLWACGECASTGAHGANRLASNSLAEAIVFGARIAADVAGESRAALPAVPPFAPADGPAPALHSLRALMTREAGLERNGAGLRRALREIARLEQAAGADAAFRNMTAAALLIAGGALARTESRGGHYRTDYPAADAAQARRTFLTLDDARALAARAPAPLAAACA